MQPISASDPLLSVPDAALARRFATEASAEAFAALVGRYHGLVHGTARRVLRDDDAARDVVQEVFVRLAREVRRIRPEALAAWLHRTARNTALNFHRGETRRRRREQTMSDHLNAMAAPDAGEIPEHWASALEHLDAALDGLSEAERQCVLERYHQERPLRDIAASAGKSEDAARMTINRALEKMSGFLRRRGVAFSVTGLAAGLTAELSRAAPTLSGTAAASLTSAALTTAKSSGAGSGLTFFTTAVMTKTTGIIGAAALVFILALGGGWLANRPASPAAGGEPPELTAKNSPVAAEPATAKQASSRPAAAPAAGSIDDVLARLEVLRVKRMDINARIPRNLDSPPDPKVVDAVFKAMEALEAETQAVLAELDFASLPDAVAAALKLVGPARDNLISKLLGRWGALDPDKAMAAAKELPVSLQDTGRTAIARGWGQRDPGAALAAAERLNANNEGARLSFLREVFTGWLHVDAAAAVRALPGLPFDDQRNVARAFDDIAKMPAQRAAATIEIAQLADEILRAEIVNYITADWARFDGPAAAAWFDALAWENPRAGLEAGSKLMEAWGRTRQQTARALDWFWPKVPADLQPEILERFVAGKWAKVDRAAAEAWLAKHGIATSDVPEWDRLTR